MIAIPKFWRRGIRARISGLEAEFIHRRNKVQDMLIDRDYLKILHITILEDRILYISRLSLEASKLDDEYRDCFIVGKQSDPNYEQLQYMLRGVKNLISFECNHRES